MKFRSISSDWWTDPRFSVPKQQDVLCIWTWAPIACMYHLCISDCPNIFANFYTLKREENQIVKYIYLGWWALVNVYFWSFLALWFIYVTFLSKIWDPSPPNLYLKAPVFSAKEIYDLAEPLNDLVRCLDLNMLNGLVNRG